ncbi:MAG: hypothetical protein M1812_004149 [Candelaria pacifica]|nr:MAG: hypothetical protein M1812_004149 [Candelaria pacifica]
MMVPRSFSYSSRSSPRPAPRNEKYAVAATKVEVPLRKERRESTERPGTMTRTSSTTPPSTPSKPVIIPRRTHLGGLGEKQRQSSRDLDSRKSSGPTTAVAHDPNSVPPAVAALLAVTSIPPRSKQNTFRRRRSSKDEPQYSLDSVLEWTNSAGEDIGPSLPLNSPLDALLNNSDSPAIGGESVDSDSTIEPALSVRSTSSASVPSLDTDDDSTASLGSPPTPGWHIKRNSMERKGRRLASPPAEDCALDHPLLPIKSNSKLEEHFHKATAAGPLVPADRNDPGRRKSSLKSNLTSGLRAITSAARSLSSITSVAIPPEDLLTRSISFSPRDTDERRPVLGGEAPTPADRRYLNPSTNTASAARLRSHDFRKPAEPDKCTAMIQMQTYQRTRRPSRKRPTSFDKSRQAGKAGGEDVVPDTQPVFRPFTRQRELRENSDFLRVVVLELNMKRVGKLRVEAEGHARISLPPRLPSKKYSIENNGIPSRWVGEVNRV